MRSPFVFGALLALSAGSAAAATFAVDLLTDKPDAHPGDGKCSYLDIPPPDVAVCSLRTAIMEANATAAFDSIVLQDGVTYELAIGGRNEDAAATGDLDILNPIAISAGLLGRATIDAKGFDRVIHVLSDNVSLYGLDITGGSLSDGDPSTCDPSGGIRAESAADFQMMLVRVHDNVGGCGGAIEIWSGGDATLVYTDVFSNGGHYGIVISQASVEVTGSSFHDNGAHGIGVSSGASLKLTNSTVSEPDFDSFGVTVYSQAAAVISNSTLVAGWRGINVQNTSRLFMANSIMFGDCNITADSLQDLTLYDNLYKKIGCPSAGPDDNSLRNQKVFLSPLGYYGGFTPTYRPLTVSPAIDHTTGPVCDGDEYDQRGEDRKVAFKGGEAKCDIGAVELESDVIYFDSLEWL